ncbi:hypothetical protein ACFQVA_35165 [Actinomadura keratinilytica]
MSVRLNTTRSAHDADEQIELWWRAARGSLAATDGVAALLRY